MIKVFIDPILNEIKKYETVKYKEVIVDFDITDNIVIDEKTWDICLYEKSSQWLKRLEELSNQKELNDFEIAELEYLLPKTHMVNVTTEDDKKHYVIHEISEWIDFDARRWDMKFSSKEKAQEYANTFNS